MGIHGEMKRRAVFLDRDGVINRAFLKNGVPIPPGHLEEFEILPGVPAAIHQLKALGWSVFVVTNQPDIARGTQTLDIVESMHRVLRDAMPIDQIWVCPHDDADQCTCRKPKPGALQSLSMSHDIDLAHSYMVGDRWRDIDAGKAAGCKTIFIDHGYLERKPDSPDFITKSLPQAVDIIFQREGNLT